MVSRRLTTYYINFNKENNIANLVFNKENNIANLVKNKWNKKF